MDLNQFHAAFQFKPANPSACADLRPASTRDKTRAAVARRVANAKHLVFRRQDTGTHAMGANTVVAFIVPPKPRPLMQSATAAHHQITDDGGSIRPACPQTQRA
jgi:hypothetical protein